MQIHIKIPLGNPWQLIAVAAIGLWIFVPLNGKQPAAQATTEAIDDRFSGGSKDPQTILQSEETAERERIKQAVLAKREEILRYQLLALTEEAERTQSTEAMATLHAHRARLMELIREKRASENLLKESLIALWEAQGTMFTNTAPARDTYVRWPVEPQYGVSAKFNDDGYRARFGIPHHAVDIPIEQGSVIRAAADGVVSVAKDNGLGYSYVTLKHIGGIETVYGHVSGFLIAEGDTVTEGQPIALSGGRPGSPGAGLLTTGPHVHFAVKQDGVLVDPLKYLMPWKGIKDFEESDQ